VIRQEPVGPRRVRVPHRSQDLALLSDALARPWPRR